MQHQSVNSAPVAVIGGGLAGLTAGVTLARAGVPVLLLEKASGVGGRATSRRQKGFVLNQGPRALYLGGAGERVLSELGVLFSGGRPATRGYAVLRGQRERLPSSPVDFVRSRLLNWPDKLGYARLMARLLTAKPEQWQDRSVRDWVEQATPRPPLRQLLHALFRLSTYAADAEQQSAGAALAQLQIAIRPGVLYLDGGWQTLVDGLREAALAAGVEIITGANVIAIKHGDRATGVRLADGTSLVASAVIAAVDPATATALVAAGGPLQCALPEFVPVRAACLDVALSRLPDPAATLALGVDAPLYLSVHSTSAELSPPGGALIHAAKYLPTDDPTDPEVDKAELHVLLDLMQPGWRDVLVTERFLPRMTVSHALVTACRGGLAGRPGPAVAGLPGLYLAGDWVGREGMLADAALASARRAAEMTLSHEQS